MSGFNFWKNLKPGVFALAPMEDVTDTVFREMVMSVAAPGNLNLLFTEFTSVDGLCHPIGRNAVLHRLKVNKTEGDLLKSLKIKLIAQIWGNDPVKFYKAAKFIAEEYNFDGIDINMGCPVNKVIKQNTCSALINQPDLAKEIIDATIKGSGLPVSVKTRTGISVHTTEVWIGQLLQTDVSAITLHARTQKMQSLIPAEWDQVYNAVVVRNSLNSNVKILGNGDVLNRNHGLELISMTGADGIMIGRGIFADPWFFSNKVSVKEKPEKMNLMNKHIRLFIDTWGTTRNFSIMKRFFKIYMHGFEGASSIRAKLMETHDAEGAIKIIEMYKADRFIAEPIS